jgi:uncharacterized Zn-binding protein involved in type VI secretion
MAGKPAGRLGDIFQTHGTYQPSQPLIKGSQNVLCNGIPIGFLGCNIAPHVNTVEPYDMHPATCVDGSGTVLVNGQPACRVGSNGACGYKLVKGSDNVTIGG